MNEKLEIARMATELTAAVLRNSDVTKAVLLACAGVKSPPPVAIFDVIYDHLSAKLTPQ